MTGPTSAESDVAPEQHRTPAIVRFSIPDLSLGANERGLFALPGNESVKDETIGLRNYRTAGAAAVTRGPAGLDVQGFTYITHKSKLHDDDAWFKDDNLEKVYLPELEQLVREVTGASRAVVNNVACRRRLATRQEDHKFVLRRGGELDQELAKFPRDKALVFGGDGEDTSLEPARATHIDYTVQGLRDSVRSCRKDILAVAKPVIEAEDERRRGNEVKVPRYAVYSIWRPTRPVKRDPLAVCDWRSLDTSELLAMKYRALSDVNPDGEYMLEMWSVNPPRKPASQEWYWMPEQKSDEVLFIKFADTAADGDSRIAGGCAHSSPVIPGTEDEEARSSIEARVFAFWD